MAATRMTALTVAALTVAGLTVAGLAVAGCTAGSHTQTPAAARRPSPSTAPAPATATARPTTPRAMPTYAVVERVVDGDTIVVRARRVRGPVRIIGIDTPEVGRHAACHGKLARRKLARAIEGRQVRLSPQIEPLDRYGRWLADVTPTEGRWSGDSAARRLVRGGHARTMPYDPNTRDADQLARLEASARAEGRGLWARCGELRAFPPG